MKYPLSILSSKMPLRKMPSPVIVTMKAFLPNNLSINWEKISLLGFYPVEQGAQR